MGAGIKLHKNFTDQIAACGKLKRVWFTTFNLDVPFFEKYILSALMGYSYKDLKSSYDYEALNAQLANEQDSLEEDRIEVKVFYDYRALMQSSMAKQTSVHLHPVDIKQISGLSPGLKFSKGVFHPKVVLIETAAGEYWLMVSSANLTFGGWSKNRECFFFEKIENTSTGREVGKFFKGITDKIKGFEYHPLLTKLLAGKFGGKETKWNFFSSFNQDSFLDRLCSTYPAQELRVWSPYYSNDLNLLVDELIEEEYFANIEIVPAKNENQKIRLTEKTFMACKANKKVFFKEDRLPFAARESFVHAKVWLTPKSIAIGSWNMTRSGMNISPLGNNNIEAGVIYNLSPKEYQDVLLSNETSSLKAPGYYSKAELDAEKEDLLDEFIISVDLVADWDKLTIKLISPSLTNLFNQIGEDSLIKLPGIGAQKITILSDEVSFRHNKTILLTDRFFQVEDVKGKILYKGYIREIGLSSRPVRVFANIDDFLKGWVTEKPEDNTEKHRLPYNVENDNGNEINEQTRKILMSDDQNPWFGSFYAFECIMNRIEKCNKLYKKDKIAELKKIGRVLPGSLSELRDHLILLRDSYEKDKSKFLKSPIYLWFLIEKSNRVFVFFNNTIEIKVEFIKGIKNLKVENILTSKQKEEIGEVQLSKWIDFIKSKLKD